MEAFSDLKASLLFGFFAQGTRFDSVAFGDDCW